MLPGKVPNGYILNPIDVRIIFRKNQFKKEGVILILEKSQSLNKM